MIEKKLFTELIQEKLINASIILEMFHIIVV
jgi:hypothetical protein